MSINLFNRFFNQPQQQPIAKQLVPPPQDTDLQPLRNASEDFNSNVAAQQQQQEKFVKEQSWLHHRPWVQPSTPLKYNTFATVSADSFIQGSPLESSSFEATLPFYIQFFENLLLHKDDPENADIKPHLSQIQHFLAAMKACEQINARIVAIKDGNELTAYAKELSDQFAKGALQWFPGSFVDQGVFLHLKKEGSLSIVDPTDQSHVISLTTPTDGASKVKLKSQQFFTFTGLNKKRFGSAEFFQYLLEMQLSKNSHDLYKSLESYLGCSKASAHSPHSEPHLYKTPQRSGKSFAKSISTAFYYSMCGVFGPKSKDPAAAAKVYKKIKFLWQREALLEQCRQHLPNHYPSGSPSTTMNSKAMNSIEEIMQNMGREAASLHQKKLLSDQDITRLDATFIDIRQRISDIKAHEEMHLEINTPSTANLEGINPENRHHNVKFTSDDFRPSSAGAIDSSKVDTPAVKEAQEMLSAIAPKMTDPKQALAALKECMALLTPAFGEAWGDAKFFNLVNSFYEKILINFPIPDQDPSKCFWSQIPQDQLIPCMQALQKLMSLHFVTSRQANGTQHTSTDVAVSYAFLAAIDRMARRIPEAKLKDQKTNYYELLNQVKSPYFAIDNPHVQEKLQSTLKYFDPKFSIDNKHRLNAAQVAELQSKALFGTVASSWSYEWPQTKFDTSGYFYKNPTEAYLKQFIDWNDPQLAAQFNQNGITRDMSGALQLKGMMANNIPFMPEATEILRQATLFSTSLCHSIYYFQTPRDFDSLPKFTYKQNDSDLSKASLILYVGNASIYPTYAYKEGSERYEEASQNLSESSKANFGLYYSRGFTLKGNHRSQNRVVIEDKTYFDLTQEETAELMMIGCDPYDEANRAISFAHRNIPNLKKKEVRSIIRDHLFHLGRISSQLGDSSEVVDRIIEFLNDAIKYQINAGDQEACLYLVKLGFKLHQFIEKQGVHGKRSFPNMFNILLNDVLPISNDADFVKKCCNLLFKSQVELAVDGKPRDQEHLKRLAQAAILNIVSERRAGKGVDATTQASHLVWLPQVKQILLQDEPLRIEVFSKALYLATHEMIEDNVWEGGLSPFFVDGDYQINIITGDVIKGQEQLVRLPDYIATSETYKKLNISPTSHVTRKNGNTFKVYPEDIEIEVGRNQTCRYKKKFDGKTYLLNRESVDKLCSNWPTIFTVNETLLWVNDDSSHCIATTAGSDPIHLTKTAQGPYRMERSGRQLVNVSALDPVLQEMIERYDSQYIECWTKENSAELDTIALKQYGISFQMRKEGAEVRTFVQEHPGWFLAPRTPLHWLGSGAPYLILQNSRGEKKVILPKLDAHVDSSHNLQGMPTRRARYNRPYNETAKWFEYTIVDQPGEGVKLSSNDVEANMYLCYVQLANGNFARAKKILDELNPVSAFSNTEMNLIKQMGRLLDEKHPAASAFGLYLCCLVEENSLKFPPSIGATPNENLGFEAISNLCGHYMQNKGNVPGLALTEEQEMAVLKLAKRLYNQLPLLSKSRQYWAMQQLQKRLDDLESRKSGYGATRIDKSLLAVAVEKLNKRVWVPFGDYDIATIRGLFAKYDPAQKVNPFGTGMVLLDNSLTGTDFCTLYDIAASGKPEEKAKLKAQLELLLPLTFDTARKYVRALLKVIGSRYPVPASVLKQNALEMEKIQYGTKAYYKADGPSRRLFNKAVNTSHISAAIDFIAVCLNLLGLALTNAAHMILDIKFKKRWNQVVDLAKTPSTLILLNGDSLNHVDKGFGTFFKKAVDAHFVYEDRDVEPIAPHLPVDHHDALVRDKLRQENADLDNFDSLRPKKRRVYSVREGASLQAFQEKLERENQRWEETLKTQAEGLIWLANQKLNDPNRLKKVRKDGSNIKISWEDLKYCFSKGDFESFRRRTQLDDEQIQGIFQQFADYSFKKSRLDQMKQARDALASYTAVCAEKEKVIKQLQENEAAEKQGYFGKVFNRKTKVNVDPQMRDELQAQEYLLLQHLVKTLQLFPPFEPKSENRTEMLLQLSNGYFYREEQIRKHTEMLYKLKKDHEVLIELRTGFGKSKNTIPSADMRLTQVEAKERPLVVNCHPSSLEKTNTADLRVNLKKGAEIPVDAMHFDRATDITVESLTKMLSELEKDRLEGRPLNIRPETFRTLECHAVLLLKQISEGEVIENGKEKLELLLKINKFSPTKATALIDEARHNLNPKDKVIYTVNNPEILPTMDVEMIEETFKTLQTPPFKEALDVEHNKQTALTNEEYNKLMRELAITFEGKFGITSATRDQYLNFVTGESEEVPAFIKNHPRFEQMALLRGQIVFILKECFKQYVGQNFGISIKHRETKEFAIRYLSVGEPKENNRAPSEFKNPHETLIKTYMTYLYEGLSDVQAGKLVFMLQKQAFEQMGPRIPFDETPANKLFQKICPELADSLHSIKEGSLKPEHLNKIKNNRDAIFYYIRHEIAKQIKLYPKTITSTTQNFRSQFAKSISLSATPQDKQAHGPHTTLIPSQGTQGEVTHVFYRKCHDQDRILTLQGRTPTELFQETLALRTKDTTISGTVDTAGMFIGLSNNAIAKMTCDHLKLNKSKIEAVVFFDNQENMQKFMVMDVATGNVKPFVEQDTSPAKRDTQYDQNRSFASDIHHPNNGTGVVTLKKETTKSEAGQGYGRLRQGNQFHGNIKGQSPLFAVTEGDSKAIFKEKAPNITDLLVHLTANEAHEESEFNFHAIKDQMDNEVRRALLDKIVGLPIDRQRGLYQVNEPGKVDVENALSLFGKFKKEFVRSEGYAPSALYLVRKFENTVDHLKKYQQQCIDRVKNYRGLTSAERAVLIKRLQEYSSKWEGNGQKLPLPEKVRGTSASLGASCDVFIETEVEVHVEKNDEKLSLRTPTHWGDRLNLFKAGWEKPSYRFAALKTVAWFVTRVVQKIFTTFINCATKYPKTTFTACVIGLSGLTVAYPIHTLVGIYLAIGSISLGVLVKPLATRIWKALPISRCKTYVAKDVLSMVLGKQALKMFSPQLLVSDNFWQQNVSGTVFSPVQVPLSREEKPLFEVLVIQDEYKGQKQLKFLAIDQNDSQYFRKRLQEDQKTAVDAAGKRPRKIAVYDIRSNTIVAQGKNGFADGELEGNPAFIGLRTQAKLLNGEKDYSEQEQEWLKKATLGMSQEARQQLLFKCYLRNSEHNLSRMMAPAGKILRHID